MAEALAIQKLHGPNAARWTAERIDTLALVGDDADVERFTAIAASVDELLAAARRPWHRRPANGSPDDTGAG